MKRSMRMISLILALLMLSAIPLPVTAAAETDTDYRQHLRSLGFPEDYIEPLYELHLLHPKWNFEPLKVTELNSKYTWDYVIHMETADSPQRSLISASSAYTAYRHPTNTALYDSGWYQASEAAVEYFMDPRNFLNEKDIFQFEDLSFSQSVTVTQVESALSGTFMERAVLDNGKTYAEYFYEVGEELGINPLHLASRARQEQGKGTSSQISGLGGDKLWYYYSNNVQSEGGKIIYAPATGHTEQELKGYNGLYNFYNINASGTGGFAILLGALKEAKSGTPDMADKWGGSPSWDTKWKSIYGGAYKLCGSYIGNYQNTLYLQKWNVDARSKTATGTSRNFWGQYMQNVGAALSEARNSYNALAANDCLDCPYNFLIPVYSGMPASCPDPAEGKCDFYAVSDTKYSYINDLTMYTCTTSVRDSYFKASKIQHGIGNQLSITGSSLHTSAPEAFEYSIDGGEWQSMEGKHDNSFSVVEGFEQFAACTDPAVPYYFSASVPADKLPAGEHTVAVRGRVRFDAANTALNNCRYYLIAEIPVISSKTIVSVEIAYPDMTQHLNVESGSTFTMPAAVPSPDADTYFAGWRISTERGSETLLPAGAEITVTESITATPMYVVLKMRKGAAVKLSQPTALRFSASVSYKDIDALRQLVGENNIKPGLVIAAVPPSGLATLHPDSLTLSAIPYQTVSATLATSDTGDGFRQFTADTAPIGDSFDQSYAATAYVQITYSNGKTAYVCADYDRENATRSTRQVAAAALSSDRTYSSAEVEVLKKIAKS